MSRIKNERVPIINNDRCKPKKCNHECKLKCPSNGMGKKCIEIEDTKVTISEELCIGCGICARVCPFNAVKMVKLPTEQKNSKVYQYSENSFRLYKLPIPKIGSILGFIGRNGIGKSTLMKILSNDLVPNFGNFDKETDKKIVLKSTRGTELQKYLKKLYNNELTIKIKPQNIDKILGNIKKHKPDMMVSDKIDEYYETDNEWHDTLIVELELEGLLKNKIATLSGGELQRLMCALIMMQKADVYVFDEPSNYLDVKQRLKVANLIRKLSKYNNYIFIVEHDLSILDYTSDFICIIYGKPGAFGVVSTPHSTSSAINIFFNGYIPSDNVRFRTESYTFKEKLTVEIETGTTFRDISFSYDNGVIDYDNFSLKVNSGSFRTSAMIVLLGKNGSGKSTFLNYLAKTLKLIISYKRQHTDASKFVVNGRPLTVIQLLNHKINKYLNNPMFMTDVLNPLKIKDLFEKRVDKLSGGELQKVMLALCLGTDADIYLIDEPSANLDIEQRVAVTKIIKRFLLHNKKTGFIVEHDMMMAMAMSMERNSRIVVFDVEEIDGKRLSVSSNPLHFQEGINKFLAQLNITFRTDSTSMRPRINKFNSSKDIEQKRDGMYYC